MEKESTTDTPVDPRKLRSFVALAEELHFSRAAARLGVSQSTLSVRVRQLEEELGARLVDRSTRRVELTEAGRRLLAEAGRILTVLAETADAVHRGDARPLRLGSTTAARYGIVGPCSTATPSGFRMLGWRSAKRPRARSCADSRRAASTSA